MKTVENNMKIINGRRRSGVYLPTLSLEFTYYGEKKHVKVACVYTSVFTRV